MGAALSAAPIPKFIHQTRNAGSYPRSSIARRVKLRNAKAERISRLLAIAVEGRLNSGNRGLASVYKIPRLMETK